MNTRRDMAIRVRFLLFILSFRLNPSTASSIGKKSYTLGCKLYYYLLLNFWDE